MRYTKHTLLLATAALMTMGTAVAQDNPPRQAREHQQMSAEERDAAREARREHWESLSDEERSALREQHRAKSQQRRDAARERYQNMSDEERAAMRQKREEHRRQHSGNREQRRHGDSSKAQQHKGG